MQSLLKATRGKRGATRIEATGEALEDLKWWHATLGRIREASLVNNPVTASVTTDASDSKLGYIVEVGDKREEKTLLAGTPDTHINSKELEALLRALENHGGWLDGRRIVWYVDNVTAAASVRHQ